MGVLSGITHGVAIRKSSEITELSGSNGVRTFRKKLEFVSRYLVSMKTRYSPRPPRRGI